MEETAERMKGEGERGEASLPGWGGGTDTGGVAEQAASPSADAPGAGDAATPATDILLQLQLRKQEVRAPT